MKSNLKIQKISLYTNKFEKINEVEFDINRINIIAGISSSGKTQILECIKYGLLASQSAIEMDMLGQILGYIALNVLIGEKECTLIRRYVSVGTEQIYISFSKEDINSLALASLENYEKYTKKEFSNFLNEFLNIPMEAYMVNKTLSPKNIFIYSFINYNTVSDASSLVSKGNLLQNDYLALNYLVFNIFDEEEVKKSVTAINDVSLEAIYYKEQTNIEQIRQFLRQYYDIDIKKYVIYAKKLLEETNNLISYNEIEKRAIQLEKEYSDLIIARANLDYLEEYEKSSQIETILSSYISRRIFPSERTNDTYLELLKEDITQEANSSVVDLAQIDINRRREKISINIENLEIEKSKYIKKVTSEGIHNIDQKEDVIKKILQLGDNIAVLDYKHRKDLTKDATVKKYANIITDIMKPRIIEATNNLLYDEEVQGWYDVLRDLLQEKDYVAEKSGGSYKRSCRKVATLSQLHGISDYCYGFLCIDQPLQALSNDKTDRDEALRKYWVNLVNIFATSYNEQLKTQLILVENYDNIFKEEQFRAQSVQKKYYVCKRFNKAEKLIPQTLVEKYNLQSSELNS